VFEENTPLPAEASRCARPVMACIGVDLVVTSGSALVLSDYNLQGE